MSDRNQGETLSQEMHADAEFLRDIADNVRSRGWDSPEQLEEVERIKSIANTLDQHATAMFHPPPNLEKRADEVLTAFVTGLLDGDVTELDDLHTASSAIALWLIQRRLSSLGTKALIGDGLQGVGAAAVTALLGGLGKATKNAGEDK